MNAELFDLPLGQQLRNEVVQTLEQVRSHWVGKARMEAVSFCKKNGTVCSDDIWAICPPPTAIDPRTMGAVFGQKDVWERVTYKQSHRPKCHARPIPVWKLR